MANTLVPWTIDR